MALNVYFKLIDDTTLPILEELRRYRYKSIKYWINPVYTPHNYIRDYNDIKHERIDHQLTCFDWNIDLGVAEPQNEGLEHLVSRFLTDGTKFVIVDNCQHSGNQLVLFQDASHLKDFPQGFVKVPCFCNFQDLFDYAISEKIFSFSLENNADFQKINKTVQGKNVYKEKKNSRYWYLDNLHKNHYEVFDNTGIHLGEANLEGELDTAKKDKKQDNYNINNMSGSSKDKITTVLEDLIDKKGIVFWYDNEGQWTSVVDNLSISGVTRLNLAGNPFSIKYQILKGEQPSRGFLIYSKDERPTDVDNWLLNLETEGIVFSADIGSLYAAECGIPMELKHKIVDPHIEFFKFEDNRKQLSKRINAGMDWQKIIWQMIGITAKTEPTYDQILLAMIQGLSNEDNSITENLIQFGLADTFWSEIKELFGYAGNESLKELLIVLFKDDMIRHDGHKHLTNAAHIFMRDWRDSRTYSEVYKTWAKILESELGVDRELEDYTLDQLIEIETFPCVDKLIAIRLQHEVMNQTMTSEQMESIVRIREHKIFWSVAEHTIRAMVEARRVVAGIKRIMPGLLLNTPEEAFRLYCSELYRIDSDYRHFFREAKLAESKNLIAPIIEMVQKVYSNSYLDELARKWQPLVDSMSKWRINNIDSQSNFYQYHVKPFIDKNRKVFIIISDGMRYETMMELQERIEAVNRTETKMRPAMVSTLPSYTQLGMASLLPHRELGYDKEQDEVFADGMSTKGTSARQNILQRNVPKSWAITAKEFLDVINPKSVFKEYDLIYIYSNKIDYVGDKRETEREVFNATEEEFDRIVKIVELIRNGNGSNILITADHGYIYQDETLDESEFSDFKPGGKVITDTRRFVVGSELKRDSVIKTWKSEDVGIKPGKEIQIAKGMNRMRKQGSGSRYVHGGSMLQEIVIPVLHVNIKKGSNISQVDVDILNRRSKITTNKQTISFYQTEAVSEKVTPITLRVGFYDDNNNLLSDSPILTFNTTSEDATQREQKHVFIFQNRLSSLNGKEVVLRMERQIPNTDKFVTYKEEAYKVSVMFANEF